VGWLPTRTVAARCWKDAEGERNRMGGNVLERRIEDVAPAWQNSEGERKVTRGAPGSDQVRES